MPQAGKKQQDQGDRQVAVNEGGTLLGGGRRVFPHRGGLTDLAGKSPLAEAIRKDLGIANLGGIVLHHGDRRHEVNATISHTGHLLQNAFHGTNAASAFHPTYI